MVCLHLTPRCAKIRFYFNNGALMLGQSILSTGVVEMISISLAEQQQDAAELFTAKRILPTKNNFSYYFMVQSILSAVILLSSVSAMI